jgi:uncharacterized protein involved in exopolysaccharide biosynthesis
VGLIYLHLDTKEYTASIVVGPTSAVPAQAGLGSLSGLSLGGFGGITAKISSFVGGNSGSPVAPFDAFQQTLTSKALARRLLMRQNLMQRVFFKSWSNREQRWRQPTGIGSWLKNAVRALLGLSPWHPPDEDSVEDYLEKNLAKVPQPGSSLIELSFEFQDPQVAQEFLRAIYSEADNIVRGMDLKRSTEVIKSVNAELNDGTLSASARQTLIQFLDQEYQVKSLASANVSYSADVFDDASVTTRPTSPTPLPVLLIGVAIGGLLGLAFDSLRSRFWALFRRPAVRTRSLGRVSVSGE